MNQPTREEFEDFKQEIRGEVRKLREQITEPIPATTRIEVASADVLNQLKALDQKQDEHFNQLKEGLEALSRRQNEYDKGLLSHSRGISTLQNQMNEVSARFEKIEATMATKQDLATLKTAQDARFDQLEAARDEHNRKLDEQHDMLRQILRLLGQKE